MKINFESSYKNRENLDIHPEVWKRPQNEIIDYLTKNVEKWNQIIIRLEKLQDRTIREEALLKDVKKYISIIYNMDKIKRVDGTIYINGMPLNKMNDVTLAYNLGDLSEKELKQIPNQYIIRWERWKKEQSNNNPYWKNPLHC